MGAPAARRPWPRIRGRGIPTARLAVDSQRVPAAEADLPAFGARVRSLQAELLRQIEAEPGVSAVTLAAALPGAEPGCSSRWKRGPRATDGGGVTSERIRSTGPSSRYSTSRLWRAARSTVGISPRRQRRSWTRRSRDRWWATTMPSADGSGRFLPRARRPAPGTRSSGSFPTVPRTRPSDECMFRRSRSAWTCQPTPSGPACRARSGRDVASPARDRHEPRSHSAPG